MSEAITLELDVEEAKALYRHLVKSDDSTEDERLARLRRRLEKTLFACLSIKEMEALIRSDEHAGMES